MARLIYAYLASLDGYIADESGGFDWAMPDEEVHRYVNDLQRPIGTYLYGRRMYETMAVWETDPGFAEESAAATRDFAELWQAAEKVVYSRTLDDVSTARTRLERAFEPGAVRRLKAEADRDLSVAGAELGAQALAAGLVDECHLFVSPIVVGGGKRLFPLGVRLRLELLGQHRFDNGMVHLRYRAESSS